jgi:hypothetical protein
MYDAYLGALVLALVLGLFLAIAGVFLHWGSR